MASNYPPGVTGNEPEITGERRINSRPGPPSRIKSINDLQTVGLAEQWTVEKFLEEVKARWPNCKQAKKHLRASYIAAGGKTIEL